MRLCSVDRGFSVCVLSVGVKVQTGEWNCQVVKCGIWLYFVNIVLV